MCGDLTMILRGIGEQKIPLLISSAGGAGSRTHVEIMLDILREVCQNLGIRRKVAVIYADIDPAVVGERLRQGRVTSCASSPELTQKDVDSSVRIVAQMGAEPILEALRRCPEADIVLAGRAYDPLALCGVLHVPRHTGPRHLLAHGQDYGVRRGVRRTERRRDSGHRAAGQLRP